MRTNTTARLIRFVGAVFTVLSAVLLGTFMVREHIIGFGDLARVVEPIKLLALLGALSAMMMVDMFIILVLLALRREGGRWTGPAPTPPAPNLYDDPVLLAQMIEQIRQREDPR